MASNATETTLRTARLTDRVWATQTEAPMEHRWGHRQAIDKFVRLKLRSGFGGCGRLRNVSISGAWVTTELPVRPMSYVQLQFVAMQEGRRSVVQVEGQVVRTSPHGFGIEWYEFAHPAVLAFLTAHPSHSATFIARKPPSSRYSR
jgi:hypothetical protein